MTVGIGSKVFYVIVGIIAFTVDFSSIIKQPIDSESEACTKTFNKETIDALQRAQSIECRRKIQETYDIQYPSKVKSTCDFYQKVTYLGCFQDNERNRLFLGDRITFPGANDPYECANFCSSRKYVLAGMQMGFGCICDNQIVNSKRIDEKLCDIPCPGNSSYNCGGKLTLNVYQINEVFKSFSKPLSELRIGQVSHFNYS